MTSKGKATRKYLQFQKRQIQETIKKLRQGSKDWVGEGLPFFYAQGQKKGLEGLGISTPFILGKGAFHTQTIEALAENLNGRFEDVCNLIGRKVNDVYRQVAIESVVSNKIGFNTIKQSAKRIREELAFRGITGFVDKAGRKWNMKTYAEMAARTVSAEATRRGQWNEFLEHGEDLVQVSSHSSECPLCAPWEGAILSISGKTKGYPTVADAAAAGLWHPNCLHSTALYVPGEKEGKTGLGTEGSGIVGGGGGGNEIPPSQEPSHKFSILDYLKPEKLRKREEFVPAKSIAEAEKWARENGIAKHVSYRHFDLILANEWNKTIHEYQKEFRLQEFNFVGTAQEHMDFAYNRDVRKHFEALRRATHNQGKSDKELWKIAKKRVKKLTVNKDTQALFWNKPGACGVSMNKRFAKNIKRLKREQKASVRSGWAPVGTEDTVYVLHHEMGHALDALTGAGAHPTVRGLFSQLGRLPDGIKSELSGYGEVNRKEFVAEAWSEYKTGSPRKTAKAVGDCIMQVAKDKGFLK